MPKKLQIPSSTIRLDIDLLLQSRILFYGFYLKFYGCFFEILKTKQITPSVGQKNATKLEKANDLNSTGRHMQKCLDHYTETYDNSTYFLINYKII